MTAVELMSRRVSIKAVDTATTPSRRSLFNRAVDTATTPSRRSLFNRAVDTATTPSRRSLFNGAVDTATTPSRRSLFNGAVDTASTPSRRSLFNGARYQPGLQNIKVDMFQVCTVVSDNFWSAFCVFHAHFWEKTHSCKICALKNRNDFRQLKELISEWRSAKQMRIYQSS